MDCSCTLSKYFDTVFEWWFVPCRGVMEKSIKFERISRRLHAFAALNSNVRTCACLFFGGDGKSSLCFQSTNHSSIHLDIQPTHLVSQLCNFFNEQNLPVSLSACLASIHLPSITPKLIFVFEVKGNGMLSCFKMFSEAVVNVKGLWF